MADGIITGHWSATPPRRLRDYHIEAALKGALDSAFHDELLRAGSAAQVDFEKLRALFDVWKNDPLTQPTDYGTWEINRDPRDRRFPNVEIGMVCMWQASTTSWGEFPFTVAHAWMLAALAARVAQLKSIDIGASFGTDVEPGVLQNGPIFAFSTHAERAIQTYNPPPDGASDEQHAREYGYYLGSGDPNLRWDIAVYDPEYCSKLADADTRAIAKQTAALIRSWAHEIKAAGIHDMWGLDGGITP